jgi:filamentous hemagglutinin family protein
MDRKQKLNASTAITRLVGLAMLGLGASMAQAQALPVGGVVTGGQATITTAPNTTTINQTSQNTAINWQSFNVAAGNTVNFIQPNSRSVALNRVTGSDGSTIMGSINANGQVFLVNPNGVTFGKGAQVNVGGLVASTLGISDADFMAGDYKFSGSGGSVLNEGSIKADGGYVALLGANVSNKGLIQANLGTVALAAGNSMTLDVAGDGLLNVAISEGAVNGYVANGGLLRANGGQVVMTAQGAGDLLKTVVNNTGVIEARTLGNREGKIFLLGDMKTGTMQVGGTLDASASDGGNGGSIETSSASVEISDGVYITSAAPLGKTGTWLIDPKDFIIGAGGDISGATLSAQLVTNNVTISTIPSSGDGTGGAGDIFVNDAIAWTASGTPTTLTLNSLRDVNINAAITATKGNLVVCCGRDANVNAPITTVNGSILLNAGQDVKVFFAITTTDGNIVLCAGRDIHVNAKMTLTRGSTIPGEAIGLPVGLTLIAGSSGRGPGVGGGTLIFAPLAPPTTVTKAPVNIYYNPVSYSAPTDYRPKFVLTEGATVTQKMLLFPTATKVFDGTNSAVLSGFNTTAASGVPTGVSLVAGPNATATFDSSAVGTGVGVTFTGYSLTGPTADQYALAAPCCVAGNRTTGTITASGTPVVTPPAPTPTPTPTPTPSIVVTPVAPTPVSSRIRNPWSPVQTIPAGLALAVIDSGIKLPAEQLAEAQPVEEQPVAQPVEQPVTREEEIRRANKPIIYPRKQARN